MTDAWAAALVSAHGVTGVAPSSTSSMDETLSQTTSATTSTSTDDARGLWMLVWLWIPCGITGFDYEKKNCNGEKSCYWCVKDKVTTSDKTCIYRRSRMRELYSVVFYEVTELGNTLLQDQWQTTGSLSESERYPSPFASLSSAIRCWSRRLSAPRAWGGRSLESSLGVDDVVESLLSVESGRSSGTRSWGSGSYPPRRQRPGPRHSAGSPGGAWRSTQRARRPRRGTRYVEDVAVTQHLTDMAWPQDNSRPSDQARRISNTRVACSKPVEVSRKGKRNLYLLNW